MLIFPAIDLYEKKAVRLFQGDYSKMTVYSDNPIEIVKDFENKRASHLHLVDLEGARLGTTANLSTIESIIKHSDMFVEVGGGIRSMEIIDKYLSIGVDRVILGTAAVTNPDFLNKAVEKYKDKIAVGVDSKDGFVAIKGWLEKSEHTIIEFCKSMQEIGIKTIICTDISKDGAMKGSNHKLYHELSENLNLNIIASGGVSSIEDIKELRLINLYGAIIGKAYYNKAISLEDAIEVAK